VDAGGARETDRADAAEPVTVDPEIDPASAAEAASTLAAPSDVELWRKVTDACFAQPGLPPETVAPASPPAPADDFVTVETSVDPAAALAALVAVFGGCWDSETPDVERRRKKLTLSYPNVEFGGEG